jgi:large subunit ribosomal protein L21
MYAIIDDSGQQFRVQEGDQIEVDLREAEPGSTITFDRVMLIGGGDKTLIGKPHVGGASVAAEVVDQTLGEKVVIYKYKARKKYRRKTGHRQQYLMVKITSINAG